MSGWSRRALGVAAAGGLVIPGARAEAGKDVSLCLSCPWLRQTQLRLNALLDG